MAKQKGGKGGGGGGQAGNLSEVEQAVRDLEAAAAGLKAQAANVTSLYGEDMAKKTGGQVMGQAGGQAGGGGVASLEVTFDPQTAPPPAFASICVVHRFPEYVLVDFGSIDPLRVEPGDAGGQKAMLQHVGRLCLPASAAKRLMNDLMNIYGGEA